MRILQQEIIRLTYWLILKSLNYLMTITIVNITKIFNENVGLSYCDGANKIIKT
jgi:hypothetical protein